MGTGMEEADELDDKECNDEDDRLGFFRFASEKSRQHKSQSAIQDQTDSCLFRTEQLQDWSQQSVRDSIRDCFVTGKWKEDEELLALDDLEEDSEGDFEDLETGQVHQAKSS